MNNVSENKLIQSYPGKKVISGDIDTLTILQRELLLSVREKQIAFLIIAGNNAREVAEMLFISTRTVEKHIGNMKQKLGCRKKSVLIKTLFQIVNR